MSDFDFEFSFDVGDEVIGTCDKCGELGQAVSDLVVVNVANDTYKVRCEECGHLTDCYGSDLVSDVEWVDATKGKHQ